MSNISEFKCEKRMSAKYVSVKTTSCHNAVLLLWLGLRTKVNWLGLE